MRCRKVSAPERHPRRGRAGRRDGTGLREDGPRPGPARPVGGRRFQRSGSPDPSWRSAGNFSSVGGWRCLTRKGEGRRGAAAAAPCPAVPSRAVPCRARPRRAAPRQAAQPRRGVAAAGEPAGRPAGGGSGSLLHPQAPPRSAAAARRPSRPAAPVPVPRPPPSRARTRRGRADGGAPPEREVVVGGGFLRRRGAGQEDSTLAGTAAGGGGAQGGTSPCASAPVPPKGKQSRGGPPCEWSSLPGGWGEGKVAESPAENLPEFTRSDK